MDEQRCQTIRNKWRRYQGQGQQWNDDRDWENNVKRKFDKRIKQAGIKAAGKKLTLHVLRKCFTQNVRNRLPENVALAITGHSSSDTANRFYSTVDEKHLKEAAAVIDDLLATDRKMTFSGVSGKIQKVEKNCQCR
jgi:integrase